MGCRIYRVRGNRYSMLRRDPETLLRTVLEGKVRELLIEIDDQVIRRAK